MPTVVVGETWTEPPRTDGLSSFTKPVYRTVNAGLVAPSVRVVSTAVTVSADRAMVKVSVADAGR